MDKLPENKILEGNKEKFKKVNIFLEQFNSNIELPVQVSEFEYPEKFKQETGIVGYERTLVSNEALVDFLNKHFFENLGIKSKECGVDTIEKYHIFRKKLSDYYLNEGKIQFMFPNEEKKTLEANEKEIEDLAKNKGFSLENIRLMLRRNTIGAILWDNKLSESMLDSLTGGEYPARSLNHIMSYYAGNSNLEKYNKQFIDDKFFMQKIYGIEAGTKLQEQGLEEHNSSSPEKTLFSHWDPREEEYKTSFCVFKKDNNEFIKKIEPWEITEYVDRNDIYLSSAGSGLNTSPRMKFFGTVVTYHEGFQLDIFSKSPSFGFYADDWFKEYIEKVIKKYSEINEKNKGPIVKLTDFAELCFMMDLPTLMEERKKSGKSCHGWWDWEETKLYFNNLQEKYKNLLTYQFSGDKKQDGYFMCKEILFPRIPIFINSDEILQLRWGHAKYSHFMTSKGLNIIKMKHDDNFFKKQNEK